MAILWKPTGSLDINTAPTDLPEQANGSSIVSGAMTRCKNLRIDRQGIAELRHGSVQLATFVSEAAPDLILEVGGHRYTFAGNEVFYDEVKIEPGVQVDTPTFSPVAGSYMSDQTVSISCTTARAIIYYTTDGSIPTTAATRYTGPFVMLGNNWLKAIAVDPLGYLYESFVAEGYYATFGQNTLITETGLNTLITETDSNTLTTEGP